MNQGAAAAAGFISICVFIFVITTLVLFVISLLKIIKGKFEADNDKIVWLLIVLLTGPLGQILFWTIGRKKIKQ